MIDRDKREDSTLHCAQRSRAACALRTFSVSKAEDWNACGRLLTTVGSGEQERMDALTEALVRLLRRQEETEQRLVRLEAALRAAGMPAEASPPVSQVPEPAPAEVTVPQPQAETAAAPSLPVADAEAPRELETEFGLTWVSRIGAVTLLFCAAFLFKYAIEKQWIGPGARVVLGVFAGVAALGWGERLWRGRHAVYGQAVSGLGISILYVSLYASFGLYHLLPAGAVFVLMAAVTAVAIWLALRYGTAAMAALGLLGGYLTPGLLSTGENRAALLFAYVLVLDAGALWLARTRDWLKFEAFAVVATVMIWGAWYTSYFSPEQHTVVTVSVVLFYALFLLARKPSTWVAAQLLAVAGLAFTWSMNPGPYLVVAIAVTLAGLIWADSKEYSGLALAAGFAFWCVYGAWYIGLKVDPVPVGRMLGLLTVAFLCLFLWTPWQVVVRKRSCDKADLLLASANAVAYYTASYTLLSPGYHGRLGLFTAAMACLYFGLGELLRRRLGQDEPGVVPRMLANGIGVALFTLAIPVQFAGYGVTISWAAEGAALSWIGRRTGMARVTNGALAVLGLSFLRLWSVDVWRVLPEGHSLVANSRFVICVATTAALWASARWTGRGRAALVVYLAGHSVLFGGLVFEISDWAARWAEETPANAESAGISVLMAVYAMTLILVGVVTATRVNRILGLLLIGAVIGKLYLADVWILSLAYRIIAFGVGGVLLMGTSYVYSRHREKIQTLWRERTE